MNCTRFKKRLMFTAFAVCLTPFLVLACLSWSATKPSDLGVHEGHLLPCPPIKNCVHSRSDDRSCGVQPIRFRRSATDAMEHLRQLIQQMPRSKVVKSTDTYLHAEFTSPLFRFVDDAEFSFDTKREEIHFRSASRVGYSDLGANRDRMNAIREQFEKGGN